jgi:hypothetical protein
VYGSAPLPDILPLCSTPHRALLTLPAMIPFTRNPRRGRADAGAAGGEAGGHLPGDRRSPWRPGVAAAPPAALHQHVVAGPAVRARARRRARAPRHPPPPGPRRRHPALQARGQARPHLTVRSATPPDALHLRLLLLLLCHLLELLVVYKVWFLF